MNRYITSLCLALLCFCVHLQGHCQSLTSPPSLYWSRQISNPSVPAGYFPRATGLAVDERGGTIISGFFDHRLQIDTFNLVSQGNADAYMAKLDTAGKVAWLRQLAGPDIDRIQSVACGPNGLIAAVGSKHIASVSALPDSIADQRGGFLRLYNTDGELLWEQLIRGKKQNQYRSAPYPFEIQFDASGNIYLAGTSLSVDTLFFGATMLPRGIGSGFVAKYAPDGTLVWARKTISLLSSMTVDEAGNCYIAGNFWKTVHMDNVHLALADTVNGRWGGCIIKLRPDGRAVWGYMTNDRFDDGPNMNVSSIRLEPSGTLIVAIRFLDSLSYHGRPLLQTQAGKRQFALMRIDTAGSPIWARPYGESSRYGIALSGNIQLAVSPTGEILVQASTVDSTWLGNLLIGSRFGGFALFQVDTGGTLSWVLPIPSDSGVSTTAVRFDRAGNTYAVGGVLGPLVIGTDTMSYTYYSGFALKLGNRPLPPLAVSTPRTVPALHPNPTQGLVVGLPESPIKVFDGTQRLILQAANGSVLNLSAHPPGLYWVEVQIDGKPVRQRLIIQR